MILENQQALEKLSTRVTTLTSMVFRVLIMIIAYFDLEIVQMNAVNVFVYCKLDEVMYMRMLSDFEAKDKILCLRKILYELRCSSLL